MDKLNQWLTLLANVGVLVGIIFLAIEIQQNTHSLEMNRQIALADAYATRNNTVQASQVAAAMSPDFGDIFAKWQRGGSEALTDAERFRVRSWETARLFRLESQYIMWEQGLLEEEFADTLRDITLRSAEGWRDLQILWIPSGGYREEIERALREIDRRQQKVTDGT
jgi:hypothetical protein